MKQIQVSKETWKKLKMYKDVLELKNFNETVKFILLAIRKTEKE